MDYCLGDPDGSATMWSAPPTVDIDGDGQPDAVALDFDGDGLADDAMADLDGDGLADHAVLDRDDIAPAEAFFTDDGTGTWTVGVDRPGAASTAAGQLRWFGLDGAQHTGGPLVDLDDDGRADERLLDINGDGLADRATGSGVAYVDTDGDGRWDITLSDADGDGKADAANAL